MSDLMAAAIVISIPLVGVCWSIERLINVFTNGKLTITNNIYLKVTHPKDMNVTIDGQELNKESKSHRS